MSIKQKIPDEMTKTNGTGTIRIPDKIREHIGADTRGKLLWYEKEDGTVILAMKPDDDN